MFRAASLMTSVRTVLFFCGTWSLQHVIFSSDRNKLRFCAIKICCIFVFFSQNKSVNVKMWFASETSEKIRFLRTNYIFRNKKTIILYILEQKSKPPTLMHNCKHFFFPTLQSFFSGENHFSQRFSQGKS